jgi:hypothetical protein
MATWLALAALLFPSASHAEVVIDDFTGPVAWHYTGTGSFIEMVNNVYALGGVREVVYDYSGPLPGNNLALIVASSGLLASASQNLMGLDADVKTFTLTYDGDSTAGANLNADFSLATEIVVNAMADFWTSSLGNSVLSVTLTDGLGNAGSLSLTPNLAANTFGDIHFSLSAFTGLRDLHLNDIDRITISYLSAPSADTYFDYVSVRPLTSQQAFPIPESDSYVLILTGLGLLGLMGRSRIR